MDMNVTECLDASCWLCIRQSSPSLQSRCAVLYATLCF